MAFNINDFQGNIAKYGTLRSHSFDVQFALPKTFQNRYMHTPGAGTVDMGQLTRLLTMRVDQVKIPGVAIQSADVNRYGVGTSQKIPFSAGFVDTSFSLTVDRYGALWYFWYSWLRDTVQFSGTADSPTGAFNEFASYAVGYKDDIVSTLTFRMYDAAGRVAMTIQLIDAFPISLNDMQVDWSETNQLTKITVGVSFKEIVLYGASTSTGGANTSSLPWLTGIDPNKTAAAQAAGAGVPGQAPSLIDVLNAQGPTQTPTP